MYVLRFRRENKLVSCPPERADSSRDGLLEKDVIRLPKRRDAGSSVKYVVSKQLEDPRVCEEDEEDVGASASSEEELEEEDEVPGSSTPDLAAAALSISSTPGLAAATAPGLAAADAPGLAAADAPGLAAADAPGLVAADAPGLLALLTILMGTVD